MGGRMYLGNQMVTPVIVDYRCSFDEITGDPMDNEALAEDLNAKQDVIEDLETIRSGASAGATALQPDDLGNSTLTIQKNSSDVGTFTANSKTDATINITVPTSAADVSALPDSTKYGASLSLSINSSTYVVTAQLKDQDGNNLGSSQTIDLPLESVVVNGSYDSVNKKIILTLQNGNTIDVPVGDLVAGLQSEITSSNKLSADLVDDSTTTNKFVTASDKTTWSSKQDAITGAASTITSSNLTASLALISNNSGKVDVSSVTSTELGYLSGTTSSVQTQLNAKQNEATALNFDYISNCITEISQDIKIELSSGTLTLKSGSVVTLANGTQKTTSSDMVAPAPNVTAKCFVMTNENASALRLTEIDNSCSGPTDSLTGIAAHVWFDTTNMVINHYGADGVTKDGDRALPVAIVTVTSGVITSIDQVLNGAGYIGHHTFVLPGIKGLFANGRNVDGTLKSSNLLTTSLVIVELNSSSNCINCYSATTIVPTVNLGSIKTISEYPSDAASYSTIYVEDENAVYYKGASTVENAVGRYVIVADYAYDGTSVTKFYIRQSIKLATMDDINNTLGDIETLLQGI